MEQVRRRITESQEPTRIESRDLYPLSSEPPTDLLPFLLKAARQFSTSLDFFQTLTNALRLPLPLLADACLLCLPDDEGQLTPHHAAHDRCLEERVQQWANGPALNLEDTELLSGVANTGQPLLITDLDETVSSGAMEDDPILLGFRSLGVRSAILIPLRHQGMSFGVFAALSMSAARLYTSEEFGAAREYGEMAAQALHNARLYGQAKSAYVRERSIAETFQRSFMSNLPNQVPGLEIAHLYVPAQEQTLVGGDFYDMFKLGENHYSIVLGDVSGKGIEAAILTAMAKYNLRGLVSEFLYPSTVLSKLSVQLSGQLPPERFVSLFYGVFNLRGHQLLYANAGHEAALIEHATGEIEALEATGPILGLIPDNTYEESTIVLEAGSSLLIFTDGLTEARRGKKLLGREGVQQLFEQTRGLPPQKRLQKLLDGTKAYCKGNFRDDIAVLLVHLTGAPSVGTA